ncbi:hypothetical protein BHE74_00005446 [Ensete ventricosum]|nr:hypothetical protein BHE74_00005446 [Ensete ventricosum]
MGSTYRSVKLPVRGPPATGQFRQKSTVGGCLKKKRKRRKKEAENTSPARYPRPRTCGRFFSRARRRSVSPCGEKDRGDVLYRYQQYIGTPVRISKSNLT